MVEEKQYGDCIEMQKTKQKKKKKKKKRKSKKIRSK